MIKQAVSAILALGLALGSGNIAPSDRDLTGKLERNEITPTEISAPEYQQKNPKEELTQFSLELMQQEFEQNNVLISPLSILSALGMTMNGAKGETLAQMEQVFHTEKDSLNEYLYSYLYQLPSNEGSKINLANSVWIRDEKGLKVKKDFLQTALNYYDSQIYKEPFNNSTKKKINDWVKKETDGMIPKVLNEAPPKDAMMYLVNALSFDGKWSDPYFEHQVWDGIFTTESGEKQDVTFMGGEQYGYIRLENASGFGKPYKDGAYEFVALLPDEGVSMQEFLSTLDAEAMMQAVENRQKKDVRTKMPKFSAEYDSNLNESLMTLGMTDAFDSGKADFSLMASSSRGPLFISNVIHKTKIDVNEQGTKAGAATVVEIRPNCASIEEPKEVFLDRPFFYMIVDCEQNFPIFMGCLMKAE